MATLSGTFTGPAVSASVSYVAGGAITFDIEGVWRKAIINVEVSADAGVTWQTVWWDYGITGQAPGSVTAYPPGAGLLRLRCTFLDSGAALWSLTA